VEEKNKGNGIKGIRDYRYHRDPNIGSSYEKVDENFANYFLETKFKNSCMIILKCTHV